MAQSTHRSNRAALLAPILIAGLALGACSDGGSDTTGESTPTDAAASDDGVGATGKGDSQAADLLPESVRERGYVEVATTFGAPPLQFQDESGEPTGSTIDLSNALGEKLGIEFRQISAPFDSILGGLTSGRYDLSVGGLNITDERRQVLNFVEYLDARVTLIINSDRSSELSGWADFCGETIGQVLGSVQIDQVNASSEEHCTSQGKPAIEVVTFNGSDDIYQAVATGRIDGSLRDYGFQQYAVSQSDGRFALAGDVFDSAGAYGIGTPKDDEGLGEAIAAAMNELIADGTYMEILEEWGLNETALPEATFLPATN